MLFHSSLRKELSRSFEKFQWAYDAMVVFPAAILMMSAQSLITLLYDARYHDAGWMVMVAIAQHLLRANDVAASRV